MPVLTRSQTKVLHSASIARLKSANVVTKKKQQKVKTSPKGRRTSTKGRRASTKGRRASTKGRRASTKGRRASTKSRSTSPKGRRASTKSRSTITRLQLPLGIWFIASLKKYNNLAKEISNKMLKYRLKDKLTHTEKCVLNIYVFYLKCIML